MKKIKTNYRLWLGAVWALWLVLSAATWMFAFRPQSREYAEVHKELRERADELDLARTASLEATRSRQIEMLEQTLAELGRFAIGPREQDGLVFEISRLASDLNLSEYAGKSCGNLEKSFRNGKQAPIERMFMDVTFTGSFDCFAKFLNSLERNCPILFVENISLERAADAGHRHETKLLLSMLIQTNPVTVPKAANEPARQTACRTGSKGDQRI